MLFRNTKKNFSFINCFSFIVIVIVTDWKNMIPEMYVI